MLKKLHLFILLTLTVFCSHGQILDTTTYSRELSAYTTEHLLDEADFKTKAEDTVFQDFYKLNPYRIDESIHLDLGHVASPSYSFTDRFKVRKSFDLGYRTLDRYQTNPKNTKYYYSSTPRTVLKYSQGSQDMIYLVAQHSQRVSELFTFGVDYTRIKSNNIYFGNLTDFTSIKIPNSYNTKLYTRFQAPSRRYELLANIYFDKNTLTESGGITSREHFDSLQGRNKVYFNTAQNSNANNTIRHNGFYIKQYWRTGDFQPPKIVYDSIKTDSVISATVQIPEKITGSWFHELHYKKNHLQFIDPNPNLDYYPELLITTATDDSVENRSISNTIGYYIYGPLNITAAVSHDYNSINQNGLMRLNFHNISSKLKVEKDVEGIATLSAKWKQFYTGYNAGDLHLNFKASGKAWKASLKRSNFRPDYASNYFVSNSFYWYNNFDKSGLDHLHFSYSIKNRLQLSVNQYRLSNWVIYGADARPTQLKDAVNVSNIRAFYWLQVGHWNLKSQVDFNQVSDDRLPTPQFAVKESFFYERPLFKKTMPTQIGIDFYYQTEFEGMTYNPAIRQFHLSPGNMIGNYPLFDVFLAAKVSNMKLFAIIEHVSEELFGNEYYAAANYPMMPFSFRFGLELRLFD